MELLSRKLSLQLTVSGRSGQKHANGDLVVFLLGRDLYRESLHKCKPPWVKIV